MVSLKLILGLLIFILVFHIFATVNYWYWAVWWFDMPMHFLGGFWVATVFVWLNSKFNIMEIRPPDIGRNFWRSDLPKLILVLGFVALVGVLWEFFEFGYDVLISSKGYFFIAQQGTADTMGDLFFDLMGGATAATVIFLIRKNKTNPVS